MLLNLAAAQIENALRGKRRFDFKKINKKNWECWSYVYNARGEKQSLGTIGLSLQVTNGPRLIGYINVSGGLAVRKRLIHGMANKPSKPTKLCLATDEEANYPGWSSVIVWFDREIKLDTKQAELMGGLEEEAKLLFQAAHPELG